MLNSRNLHAGLELEWGETSIDKQSSQPTSTTTSLPPSTPRLAQLAEPEIISPSLLTTTHTLTPETSAAAAAATTQNSLNTSTIMSKSIYEQESWIVKLPSVLFICLNRYKFVQATLSSSKILEPFEFYPHVFLDRLGETQKRDTTYNNEKSFFKHFNEIFYLFKVFIFESRVDQSKKERVEGIKK